MKMMKIKITLLAILAICLAFTSCGGPGGVLQSEWSRELHNNLNGMGISNKYTEVKHNYTSPAGQIFKSVVPIPPEYLVLADKGAQRQVDRFRQVFPNFTQATSISGQVYLVVHPNHLTDLGGPVGPACQNEVNEPGAPCIYVGGYKAAGTVAGLNDKWSDLDKNPVIVIPHQEAQGWRFPQYWEDTIHNEREHVGTWFNRHLDPTGAHYNFIGEGRDQHPMQWGDYVPLVGATKHYCGLDVVTK